MDIVVVDIPSKYGMLLSHSWGEKLQGSLQLDMSYATISVFGQPRKLYRETLMKYMVSSDEKPQNFPIHSMHSDMDSFILYNAEHDNKEITAKDLKYITADTKNIFHESLWHLDFDGSVNRLGVCAGVWIHNMENNHVEGHAFILNFKCTNNMAEYEALILGLQLVRKLGGKRVSIMGDSELIIKQINGEYFVNNPRLGQYRDIVLDLIKDLLETNFAAILRKQNMQAHSLATFASTCKLPFQPNHQYIAEVRHRPVIPNNLKYWQIFSQDSQIYDFMNNEGELQNCKLDTNCTVDNNIESNIDVNILDIAKPAKFTRVEIDSLENVEIEEIMNDDPEILNLKNIFFPKGSVPLEYLFDPNVVCYIL